MNYGRKDKKIRYQAITLELTRRCNMNCLWCCKGEAQNIDMPKEIINRTLDEIETTEEITNLILFGGEPLLNKEGILYTVEQIIQRKIHIPNAQVFTNGTVKDSEIKAAFFKLSRYIQECRETDKGKRQQWEREVRKKAFNGKDLYKDNNAAFFVRRAAANYIPEPQNIT